MNLETIGQQARQASYALASLSSQTKNDILKTVAQSLRKNQDQILRANEQDMIKGKQKGLNEGLLDRLKLDGDRLEAMADSVLEIVELEDPVGEIMEERILANGLTIQKKRVPIGVIGIIYEARPNVTLDAFSICFKSGNAVVLKGGSDALLSNMAITECIQKSLEQCGIDPFAIQLIESTSHEDTQRFMSMTKWIDVIIPRGSARLIQSVMNNAKVPVIETGAGNCHIYIDQYADLRKAVEIVYNAKTQRIGVCNAAESLLVQRDIAPQILPRIQKRLNEKNVCLRLDEEAYAILKDGQGRIEHAGDQDWGMEYLDYILSVKIVSDVQEAIDHINRYSTHHSECIVTEDSQAAQQFLNQIDSACVYWNASTRFTDGGVFGLGAEIGISTGKIHARGPMGLKEMTTYKYTIYGNGQVR